MPQIDRTVFAWSEIKSGSGAGMYTVIHFDGGYSTTDVGPIPVGWPNPVSTMQPNNHNQHVNYGLGPYNHGTGPPSCGPHQTYGVQDVTGDVVADCFSMAPSTSFPSRNLITGHYIGQDPQISGERTYALEFADEPGVSYTITLWVPGRDIGRDSNGQGASQFQQVAAAPTAWHKNLNVAGITSGGAMSGVAPHLIGPMEDHDVVKDGNPFQAGITTTVGGSQIAVKIAADPHNRFYGDCVLDTYQQPATGIYTAQYYNIVGTDRLKAHYISTGAITAPQASDCVLKNNTTQITELKGILNATQPYGGGAVSYHFWTIAQTLASANSTSVYDEFVSQMNVANVHETGGYVGHHTSAIITEVSHMHPRLGGWTLLSKNNSYVVPTVPGCLDINAANYSALNTTDCNDHAISANLLYPGNTDCCWYCTDPVALNFVAGASLNCDGTPIGTTGSGWNSCCTYTAPIYGCTDPLANNYNPAATIDDGTCSYDPVVTGCDYSFTELCDNVGTANVTMDLSGGAALVNIVSTINAVSATHGGCTPPASVLFPGISTGTIIDVVGECSISFDTYDPNNPNLAGGEPDPIPPWASATCGETTVFSTDTNVYVWYDTSSWGASQCITAYIAINDWLTQQTAAIGWNGNVYHILTLQERFVEMASYPMDGQMGLKTTTPGQNYYGRQVAAWLIHHNLPDWYHVHDCVGCDENVVTTTNVSLDTDGSTLASAVTVSNAQINKAFKKVSTGYTGPASFATGMPPPTPAGGDFLNVLFIDEACNTSGSAGTQYSNLTGYCGMETSSLTATSYSSSHYKELQVKPTYQAEYNNYVTLWKSWTGQSRSFLYPVNPHPLAAGNQTSATVQVFGAMVLQGNNTIPDGHWVTGTADAAHPSAMEGGRMSFFEPDGISLPVGINTTYCGNAGSGTPNNGTRHNVFWDKPNATHPDYGYGGLENYGFGINLAMPQAGLTTPVFSNDLSLFIGTGGVTTTCNDDECLLFVVIDQNGTFIPNYELILTGTSLGTTDSSGELSHTLALASALPVQTINTCWNFDPQGNCVQTRIELLLSIDAFASDIPCIGGCMDPTALNYLVNCAGQTVVPTWDDGCCEYCIYGCMNPAAVNYNPNATCDDGSCIIEGCLDPCATNYLYDCGGVYVPNATTDDGCCIFPEHDECVPNNIYYVISDIKSCIADIGVRYYNKLRTGMDDDCSTLLLWQLVFIDYILEKFELDCLYNCADSETPAASASNQGGNSTVSTNYLDKFRKFVANHCESCVN